MSEFGAMVAQFVKHWHAKLAVGGANPTCSRILFSVKGMWDLIVLIPDHCLSV